MMILRQRRLLLKDLEIFAHKKLEYFTEEPIEDADLFIDKIIEFGTNESN